MPENDHNKLQDLLLAMLAITAVVMSIWFIWVVIYMFNWVNKLLLLNGVKIP